MAAASVGASLWIFGSLFVALPDRLLDGNFATAQREFFQNKHYIFILILLAFDIFIGAIILRDKQVRRAIRSRTFHFVSVGFLGLFGFAFIPSVKPTFVLDFLLYTFAAYLVILFLIRYWSYTAERDATGIEKIIFRQRELDGSRDEAPS